MDIKTELHNLKTMVLNESHISDNSKELDSLLGDV